MNDKSDPFLAPRLVRRLLAMAAVALPAAMLAPAAMATTVSMGYGHGCSVADINQLTCWGSLPAPDFGPYRVKDVKVGRDFSCALLTNDAVRCWGNNDFSQLGRPAEPGRTMAGNYYADQIAVGARHACLRMGITVACWGDASQGQIGHAGGHTVVADATHIAALSNARHIAAGNGSTCVVQQDRTVLCIGGGSGLVDGNNDPRLPRLVPGISDAHEVALFDGHACVLRTGGKLSCWGSNLQGQLGMPASSARVVLPVEVSGLPAAAKAVAVGDGYTCALLVNGAVQCWGDNANGQLGTGLAGGRNGQVAGITDATAISAGQTAACAVLEGGYVQCWGEGAGWSSAPCRVTTGFYPGVPATYSPVPDLPVCLPQGSAAPMAVKGLGPVRDAAQVLDWAEKTMPQTFAPQPATPAPAHIDGSYYLREYPGGHRLAVNGQGTPHVLYLGPASAGHLLDLGPLSHWLRQASRDEGLQSGMRLQAGAGLNLMPGSGPCWLLQAGYSIRAGASGLPDGVEPTLLRIESAGQVMDLPITDRYLRTMLVTETEWYLSASPPPGGVLPPGMVEETVYYGMARACPTISIQQEVDITVFYTRGQKKGQLRARAKVGSIT